MDEFRKQFSCEIDDSVRFQIINSILFAAAVFCFGVGAAFDGGYLTLWIAIKQWLYGILAGILFFLFACSDVLDFGLIRRLGKSTPFVPIVVLFTVFAIAFSTLFLFTFPENQENKSKSAAEQAYEDAYDKAYKEIYNEGHDDGFDKGQTSGYEDGYYDGYHEGYEKGYAVCEDERYEYQFTQQDIDESVNIGFRDGYSEACKDFGKESPYEDQINKFIFLSCFILLFINKSSRKMAYLCAFSPFPFNHQVKNKTGKPVLF